MGVEPPVYVYAPKLTEFVFSSATIADYSQSPLQPNRNTNSNLRCDRLWLYTEHWRRQGGPGGQGNGRAKKELTLVNI